MDAKQAYEISKAQQPRLKRQQEKELRKELEQIKVKIKQAANKGYYHIHYNSSLDANTQLEKEGYVVGRWSVECGHKISWS